MSSEKEKLNRKQLLQGLVRLDELAKEAGILVDLTLYGGAALALVYDMRDSTRDVDVAIHTQSEKAHALAVEVAHENGWAEDWLNDGVKGFLSSNEEVHQVDGFSASQSGLCLSVASPRYLFAMKCVAMRTADTQSSHPGDREDIINLARLTGITTADEALDLISSFYPDNQVSAKVSFGVQEIMEEMRRQDATRPSANKRPTC